LNTVLRIPCEADYSVIDGLRPKIGAVGVWAGSVGRAVRRISFW
jgi:hypothetical protein